jgi:hypothetical protein
MAGPLVGGVGLPVLLSRALVEYTRDVEREGVGVRPAPSLPLWANLLHHVGQHDLDLRDIPRLSRLSRRAVRSGVHGLERQRWISVHEPEAPGAPRIVRATPEGERVRDAWRAVVDVVEEHWRAGLVGRLDTLHHCLAGLVAQFDLELPHYPTGY